MQTIDVHDLPEQVAKAIEGMVQTLRAQSRKKAGNGKKSARKTRLPTWEGDVIGSLRRQEIYENVS